MVSIDNNNYLLEDLLKQIYNNDNSLGMLIKIFVMNTYY